MRIVCISISVCMCVHSQCYSIVVRLCMCLCVGKKWAGRVSVCISTMLLWLGKCKMPILNYADLHLVPEPAQSACVVAHGCGPSAVEESGS